jgi:ATPase
MKRFSESAEGILISGPPGSGKSTLASSLADFYSNNQKIVKTFESPRDLQVNNKVTQYTKLDGSFENSADILLMVRPDYTIFDEVRRFQDFKTFTDLRLAGVGMVGVVHANTPLDAIQRFIGKIELGMIPHVLDTVVFVKDGDIAQVYGLKFRVKVPTGMIEQDLARPVIEIQNFESRTLEYEIYSYGEENVIIPISKEAKKSGTRNYEPTEESYDSGSELETPFNFSESRNSLNVDVGKSNVGMLVELYVKDKHLLSSRVGRKGRIKIPKKTSAAKQLMRTRSKNDTKVFLKNY